MRTTLSLDDDVARLVEEAVHRDRRTMKDVVNDALRRALAPEAEIEDFVVHVHHSALQPGLDVARLNQLADELESDAQVETMTRP